MFETKYITKRFGDEYALRGVSVTIGKGLNFIIGSSGSGKTTLLKIISGMEQDFEGEVFYCGQNIKTLTEQEKSYYYNRIFGFVWQDFNLLEDRTVLENVLLPQYLQQGQDKKAALKVLKDLKIADLAYQKVSKLSGGQKQRVAIARELIKDPRVIIADEPTSALDAQSAKTIMDILRNISKRRTVIVVTHDTSLIDDKSHVYELDKGELVAAPEVPAGKSVPAAFDSPHRLSFADACRLSLSSIKNNLWRTASTALTLILAATLLLVTVSGAITESGHSAFQQLYDTYGNGILDISVVGSFTSAGGSDGSEKDEPNANVDQNIDGLYDRYLSDTRVTHIYFSQTYNNIVLTVDGAEYKVDTSNSVPVVNELVAGVMPMGHDNEITVPKSFAERLGVSPEAVLGKSVSFRGTVYNWDSGEPVIMPVSITAKIVGVVDTTVKYDMAGQVMEYSVDDTFLFSKPALDAMRDQAKITRGESNFTLRAKTPEDMIAIKDELNAEGIVPLGRFELVEDMVRLNQQTTQQSGSAVIVIGVLAVVIVIAVTLMTVLSRRREYAIFQVSGYGKGHLALMAASDALLLSIGSVAVFLCASPLINLATTSFWNVNILSCRLLETGVVLVFAAGILTWGLSALVGGTTKAATALRTGDR